ncbi:MAG: hypothetical protein AMXMBFR82_04000 [Candidatus Hydrogenedentota bacterium]
MLCQHLPRFSAISAILISCTFFPASGQDSIGLDPSALNSFEQSVFRANQRIALYEAALESGNSAAIRQAALEVQKDPLAIRQVNALKSDAFKIRLNQDLTAVQAQTKSIIKQRLAQHYNVPESEVTFFEATNPSDVVKVGQDWDVTAQVKGKDVPLKISQQVAHEAYYEAANGEPAPSRDVAKHFAESQSVEVTNRSHPEAYGGGGKKAVYNPASGKYEIITEGGEIIVGDKGAPLRDPQQLSQVMEHKSDLGKNRALDIKDAAERFISEQGLKGEVAERFRQIAKADAQAWELEQARQYTKQFDRQVLPRVEARGGEVHNQVVEGTNILRKVAEGKISMETAREQLRAMGETPETIIRKGASQIEAAQVLGDTPAEIIRRARAGESPQDVFVDNVKDRLELKRMERAAAEGRNIEIAPEEITPEAVRQSKIELAMRRIAIADTYLQEAIGLSELGAEASAARQSVNTAGGRALGAVAVAGVAYETGSIGYKLSKAMQLLEEAALTTDEEVARVLVADAEKLEAEAVQQALDAGKAAGAMLVFPGAAGAYYTAIGAYGAGRMVLESDFLKPVDHWVQDEMTSGMEGLDDLSSFLAGELTLDAQQELSVRQKQAAWLDALMKGLIELQPGAEPADLLTLIERNPTGIASLQDPGYLSSVVRKPTMGNADAGDPLDGFNAVAVNRQPVTRVTEGHGDLPIPLGDDPNMKSNQGGRSGANSQSQSQNQSRVAAKDTGTSLPALLNMKETSSLGTFAGTWTWNGSGYDAKWMTGAAAKLYVESYDGKRIVLTRNDTEGTAKGLTARYEGVIAPGGISGTVTWVWDRFNPPEQHGTWNATVGTP